MWDPPLETGGNQIAISKYKIRIPELNYSVEEESAIHSHTIAANSTHIMFNMPYVVQVIAINTCEGVSDPANVTIIVEGSGKYMYWVMHCVHSYSHTFLQLGLVWESSMLACLYNANHLCPCKLV